MTDQPTPSPRRTAITRLESLLNDLGRMMARHATTVIACWVILGVAALLLAPVFPDRQTTRTARVDGSESARVEHLVSTRFPHLGPEVAALVFHSPTLAVDDHRYLTVIAEVTLSFQADPAVQRVISPLSVDGQVSKDRHTAAAPVFFAGEKADLQRNAAHLQRQVQNLARAAQDGKPTQIEVYLVGYSVMFAEIIAQEQAGTQRAELIGVPLALLILLLAMGTLVAACLPIVVAGAGVLLTFGVVGAASLLTRFDSTLEIIIPMMGLALGIDYALFVVARYRSEIATRHNGPGRPTPAAVENAVAAALGHAGATILLSGAAFALGMSGLLFIDAPTIRQIGVGAMLAAGCTLAAGLTLLPALLGLLGHRLEAGPLPWRRTASAGHGSPAFAAAARHVIRRPVAVTVTATVLLGLLATPALGLRLGVDLGVPALAGTAVGKGHRLLQDAFSSGKAMPITLVYTAGGASLTPQDIDAVDRLDKLLENDPAVSSVDSITSTATGETPQPITPATLTSTWRHNLLSADRRSTLLTVVPAAPSDSAPAMDLVTRIRDRLAPQALTAAPGARVLVGGVTAQHLDLAEETTGKLGLVLGFILTVSFGFLVLVLRSILVPVKAILANLLAVAAAYGLTVWVFQHGALEGLLDFTSTGAVQAFLPVLTFAFLFAVSMDYELFLVRRIHETWQRTGDNSAAIIEGTAHTALPITAAAAVMVAVFGAFVLVPVLELKQIGFALAAAVAIDATLIRVLLVPAIMRLAGDANWWYPNRRTPLPHPAGVRDADHAQLSSIRGGSGPG